MTIKDLLEYQKNFDKLHKSNFLWGEKINDSNIEMLEFLMIGLMGEVGESANIVKKIVRGDFTLKDKKKELSEEVSDIFAYLLKIIYQLDIDIEKIYLEKMKKNEERFLKYEEKKYDR